MLTMRQITGAFLGKSLERSDVQKAALAMRPLTIRVSQGVGVDGPGEFQVFPKTFVDATNRPVIRWVIPTSFGGIDVTEEVVA